MSPDLITKHLSKLLDEPITEIKKFQGGCSFSAFVIETESNKYFVKTNDAPTSVFPKEVSGLKQLSKAGIQTPEVISFEDTHLIIEFIETEAPQVEFWKDLGTQLALAHKTEAHQFGFVEDNFIGASEQENTVSDSWPDFFWNSRIHFKINQINSGALSKELVQSLKSACFDLLKKHNCHPSPLHGDLWNGNIICGKQQKAYFIDPAFYCGDRETDLAMTECFGGFDPEFYKAYEESYPLQPGYVDRKHLYNLYHMLNHWVIFGEQYKQPSMNIIEQLIS